jgi:hypothetical protein
MSISVNIHRTVPVAAAAAAVVAGVAVGSIALVSHHPSQTVAPSPPQHTMRVGIHDFSSTLPVTAGGKVMIGG